MHRRLPWRSSTRPPDAMQLARGNPLLEAAVTRSRTLARKRAVTAGVAGIVPLPGLDWTVDAALLTRLLPEISRQFGLAPVQVNQLSGEDRALVQKVATMAGSIVIGRVVTPSLVLRFAHLIGLRTTAAQASKFVPIAGPVVSGVLGYSILIFLAEQHIRDCVRVARAIPALQAAPPPVQAERTEKPVRLH